MAASSLHNLKYDMIALDLDGTLLSDDHEISERNRAVLVMLHRQGLNIAICTGRSTACCLHVLHSFPDDFDFHLVTFNGAVSLSKRRSDASGRNILYDCRLPEAIVNQVIDFALLNNCVLNVYVDDDIYADCRTTEHSALTKRYFDLTSCNYKFIDDKYDRFRSTELSKILILVEEINVDRLYEQLGELVGSTAHRVRGQFFIEIMNKDVNKGNGLAELCRALKIPLERVVAMGDGDNDVEFLSMAGLSVAMCNGCSSAKFSANRISQLSNDEDGVADELTRIFSL